MSLAEAEKFSIRRNDHVQIIAGREKGKIGKVLAVAAKAGRVTVERANLGKRHSKPTQQNPQGGVIEEEMPIHYSNVLLMCSNCNRGVRHGHKLLEKVGVKGNKGATNTDTKTKIRVCKRCKESLEIA